MTAIRAEGLYAYYGTTPAVNGLHLNVPEGATFGFLGPNGAGKTTTISMLTTLLRPTAGRAEVAGFDVTTHAAEVRRRIGIVFQESTLDLELTATENLRFQADLCGLGRAEARAAVAAMLDMMELTGRDRTPVRHFSTGLRRRLEIARGLLGSPRVLFLDEPTTGLDTQTRAAVWHHLDRLREEQGITVFFTTHQLEEAEHCDRIAIFDRGKLVTEGSPAELKSVIGADVVDLRTEDDRLAVDLLSDRFGLTAENTPGGLRLRVQDGASMVPRLCTGLGLGVRSVTVTPPSLDDVYLHHTGTAIRDSGSDARSLDSLGEGLR
ncbi:ATP-binding cassette domain-containing protein [Streptomyces griseoincarnatus]|uniref:ATP-binding cassette domain-containing protein n=1 Tax=unclassified Streptomyces TaxID=2593676 RepID=UPI000EFB5ED6|nr:MULTISPECIES: ATP-binding cassette domain-containing protein [unclassified Streptomyces]MBJ6633878.1 ATP-binding cassette domain-containing protein [Streptomyces sp. I5]MUT89851.1 ATP-binding cassette domain-containing protein [Streptomyces sp. Z38]NUV52783.1 ATP-binding cassette domain-containing protein [Streptomyces coelicolor]RMI89031.1 ABC transporter ATP-binding protein [Streptomyces sp. ZS0098]